MAEKLPDPKSILGRETLTAFEANPVNQSIQTWPTTLYSILRSGSRVDLFYLNLSETDV
jgi:hypothetical protein